MTENKTPVNIEQIKEKITEHLTKPVKKGVDLTGLIRKLRERRAKKNGNKDNQTVS